MFFTSKDVPLNLDWPLSSWAIFAQLLLKLYLLSDVVVMRVQLVVMCVQLVLMCVQLVVMCVQLVLMCVQLVVMYFHHLN